MPHVLTTKISAWKTRPESNHEVSCPSSLKEKEGEQGLKSTTSGFDRNEGKFVGGQVTSGVTTHRRWVKWSIRNRPHGQKL